MVTIRLARHGAKSVRSTRLLSLTAVMHATVASSSALVSSTQSLAKKKKALAWIWIASLTGLARAQLFLIALLR
ncbi:Uncharacterised protein [Escherichia coli]|nr:Uncharacterised protein [Escherichia coli]